MFIEANGHEPSWAWEAGLGFEANTLLDSAGDAIVSVGAHPRGGGYYGDRRHMENLAGGTDPRDPVGHGDRFAVIYEVEARPFE